MTMQRMWLPALISLVVAGPAQAQRDLLDPAALAAKIDQLIEAKYQEAGVRPAALADDAEFLRRVYLDVAGRVPAVSEARDFLADPRADKRQRLVDSLLKGPQYVNHFTNTWRSILLPPTTNQQQQLQLGNPFRLWLEKQVKENVPYSQMVREILTTPAPVNADLRLAALQGFNANPQNLTPAFFYQANELKAENVAAATARIFLGVRLECAQCHDHPFARWSREQFWEYASFFAAIQPPPRPMVVNNRVVQPPKTPPKRALKIPGTDKYVQAKFLDGGEPRLVEGMDPRMSLAMWMTSPENPYFARNAVNRVWAHFFGIGLVDPVDDEPGDDNPPSHPRLLDELSRQFISSKYDVKYLIRAITASAAYQRTSVVSDASQQDARLFARMAVKGLTPEQLFDSLAQTTGYMETAAPAQGRIAVIGGINSPRAEFLNRFASQERKTETQTSILQALALMNGKFVGDATSLERSMTLAAVADAPFMNTAQRVETLFLAALTRLPTAEEAARFAAYVDGGGAAGDSKKALADVFWTLLNSSEFILNH